MMVQLAKTVYRMNEILDIYHGDITARNILLALPMGDRAQMYKEAGSHILKLIDLGAANKFGNPLLFFSEDYASPQIRQSPEQTIIQHQRMICTHFAKSVWKFSTSKSWITLTSLTHKSPKLHHAPWLNSF